MPAPKNPIIHFKPCARCTVEIQDLWTGTRLYCGDCRKAVRRERSYQKQKKRSRQRLQTWKEKGPRKCETCSNEFMRNRNDAKRFCNSCVKERRRASDRLKQRDERKTPEYKAKYRDYMLRKNYGVTAEQVDAMLESQGNCCAICKSSNSRWDRGWHVDHNHKTGVVRGILCHNCNLMIGLADDNPASLIAASKYILFPPHSKIELVKVAS